MPYKETSMAKSRWVITAEKFLNAGQVERLIAYLERERDLAFARGNNLHAIRDFFMVRAFLETGLRCFELCALKVSDFVGHRLVVRHGKGNKPRTVLLTRATALMLQQWIEVKVKLGDLTSADAPLFPSRYGGHPSTRAVRTRVKAALTGAALPGHLSVHSLRHSYCSTLLASGKVGLGTVRDQLGHHSISVTNLYTHAIGNLDGVELYTDSTPVAEFKQNSETKAGGRVKKSSDPVSMFLSKRNQK